MKNHRKTWSSQEKLEIINYYKKWGATKTSREYSVSIPSIYKWKSAFEKEGKTGLSSKEKTRK